VQNDQCIVDRKQALSIQKMTTFAADVVGVANRSWNPHDQVRESLREACYRPNGRGSNCYGIVVCIDRDGSV